MSESRRFKVTFEVEFNMEGTYTPGRPATPPSYASGGDPPDPDEFEVERLHSITLILGSVPHDKRKNPNKPEWIQKEIHVPEGMATWLLTELMTAEEFYNAAGEALAEEFSE